MAIYRKIAPLLLLVGLAACSSDAEVASYNLSKAADQFEINRRVIFYNGVTGDYILTIEGLCSINTVNSGGNAKVHLTVTCKTGATEFKKHFLGLSDNVTYFAEQLEPAKANVFRYRVIFKPATILPAIELRN